MSLEATFLKYSADKLEQYAGRIAVCLDQLTEDQIWARNGENDNAIGNLVLHLCGNIRQWIGFGLGGKPDIRVRDREFSARGGITVVELKQRLAESVDEVTGLLRALPAERLTQSTRVQQYDLTVLEAIYHVVEHFSHHTGQILFATKLHTGSDLGFYKHLDGLSHQERIP